MFGYLGGKLSKIADYSLFMQQLNKGLDLIYQFCDENNIVIAENLKLPHDNLIKIYTDNEIEKNILSLQKFLTKQECSLLHIKTSQIKQNGEIKLFGFEIYSFANGCVFVWDFGCCEEIGGLKNIIENTTGVEGYETKNDDDDDESELDELITKYSETIAKEITDKNLLSFPIVKKLLKKIVKDYCKSHELFLGLAKYKTFNVKDFLDDVAYDCEWIISSNQCDILFDKIKDNKEVIIPKNRNQRQLLAEKLFEPNEIIGLDDELAYIVERAKDYYEINHLAKQIKDLYNNNTSIKKISETLGISESKARQFLLV